MNELELIISLFPLVFMIHEFEEIICLKRWVSKNGLWLTSKYPKLTKQVTHLGQLSVSAFTVAVLEEFVLVSIITVLALTLQWYSVWIAAITAFTFHVFLHIIQSGIIRKYIPAIITSLLSLPYLVWGLIRVLGGFYISMVMVCFVSGTMVTILNLYFVHKLALQYDKIIEE